MSTFFVAGFRRAGGTCALAPRMHPNHNAMFSARVRAVCDGKISLQRSKAALWIEHQKRPGMGCAAEVRRLNSGTESRLGDDVDECNRPAEEAPNN